MGKKNLLFLVAGLMVQGVLNYGVHAQDSCGGIMGRVTTEDGARVPGVIITIKSKDTKKTENAKTDGEGQYALCLPPGIYDVLVNQAAFRRAERKKIKVTQVGKPSVDFVLKFGKPIIIDPDHP
jgi:Carboxypeptidase regulatory-like domain